MFNGLIEIKLFSYISNQINIILPYFLRISLHFTTFANNNNNFLQPKTISCL